MASQAIVGVDFGSSRIKAAAYDRAGQLIEVSAVDTPLVQRKDGDDFPVADMLAAAAEAIAQLGLPRGTIAAVSTASMGETGTVLGRNGLADVGFPSWYDSRGADIIERLAETWGETFLRNATGRHFRTASTVAKLGHLREADGPLPDGVFLGICGALAWQLTGVAWQEAGLATTSGVFDITSRDYLTAVWDDAGLGNVDLPPVRAAGHGERASTDLARSLGLAEDALVVIAGHDHPVACVGAGVRAGEIADSMGTGEAIIAPMGARGDDRAHLSGAMSSDRYLAFEIWPADGSIMGVWERLRPGLAMRTFVEHSELSREELDAAAPRPAPGSHFRDDHSLAMELAVAPPIDYSPQMWGHLVDFYVELANRGQRLLRDVSGAQGPAVLTGGGLRSARWRASKALLGDGPMEVSLVQETGTRGCAAIAGASIGWWTTASDMPGVERLPIGADAVADMDAAAHAIGW